MGAKRNRKNKKNAGKDEKNEEIKTGEVECDTVEEENKIPVIDTSSEYQETSAESPEKSSKNSEITPTIEESKSATLVPTVEAPKVEAPKIIEEHEAENLNKVVNIEAKEEKIPEVEEEAKTEPEIKVIQPEDFPKDSIDLSDSVTQILDSSDSNTKIPDLSANLSSTSFIAHSSIENPPIDDSIVDYSLTENPPIFPKKPTVYTELAPEIEPYYKKFHLDHPVKAHEYEFSIHYETQFGEKIVLVGESEELGQWDVNKGIKLNWNPDHFWTIKVPVSTIPIEYKYVCLSSEQSIWEKGKNHLLDGKTEYIKDSWQAI